MGFGLGEYKCYDQYKCYWPCCGLFWPFLALWPFRPCDLSGQTSAASLNLLSVMTSISVTSLVFEFGLSDLVAFLAFEVLLVKLL